MKSSIKDKIKLFWRCVEKNKIEEHVLDEILFEYRVRIYKKLSSHGQLSFDSYLNSIKKYYRLNKLKEFQYEGKHSHIKEEIDVVLKNLFFKRYLLFKKLFSKNEKYKKLKKVYKKLCKTDMSHSEKVLLVDACIHIEHNSGNIFNINIEKLRKEYEKSQC